MSSGQEYSLKTLIVGGLVVLLFGAAIGYFSHGGSSKPKNAPAPKGTPAAQVAIQPLFVNVTDGAQTAEGATKAFTSFVSGFPASALTKPDDRDKLINNFLAPNADAGLADRLQVTLEQIRERIVGPPGAEHPPAASLVTSPLTYKVDMNGTNQATVSIWYVSVIANANGPSAGTADVESTWTTATAKLMWTDHWRMTSYSSVNGPTPPLTSEGGRTSEYNDVIGTLNGFKAYRSALAAG